MQTQISGTTAIQTWQETIQTIKFLLKRNSDNGFVFEKVFTNLAIVILVTGYETYCKRRFSELEDEGVQSDFNSLLKEFTPKNTRDLELNNILKRAQKNSITPTQQYVKENKINFQDYESCKNSYRKGFNIKFSDDLRLESKEIKLINDLIKYRHQVIHESPLKTEPPDINELHQEEIKPKNEYAINGMNTMNKFIQSLHLLTVNLRKTNESEFQYRQIISKNNETSLSKSY
jgi:hypothetical protein